MYDTRSNSLMPRLKFLDFASFAAYAGYAAGTVIIPMTLLMMSETLDFSIAEGGLLHLLRSGAMVISMLLAGVAAYRFGKIKVIGISLLLMAAGLSFCGSAETFAFLISGVIITGIGNGFFESLLTSSVADRHMDAGEASKCINLTHSFWSLGVVVMVLGAGYWLQFGVNWRYLLIGIAVFLSVTSFMFFISSGNVRSVTTAPVRKEMVDLLKKHTFRLFLLALFLAGGGEHCLTFWIPGFMKLAFGSGDTVCGVAAGCFAGGMFCGRFLSGIFFREKLSGLIKICAFSGMILSLLISGMNSVSLVMVMLFALGIAAGPLWPSLQFCCARIMKPAESTAVYILMPLLGIPGCGFITWLMGLTSEYCGMKTGFLLVPLCSCGVWIIMLIISKSEKRRKPDYE